jgi:hypothetical protein
MYHQAALKSAIRAAGVGKGDFLDGISVLGNRVFINALNRGKLFSVPILVSLQC